MVSGPGQLDGLLLLSQLHVQKKQAGPAKERAEEAKQLADDLQDPPLLLVFYQWHINGISMGLYIYIIMVISMAYLRVC